MNVGLHAGEQFEDERNDPQFTRVGRKSKRELEISVPACARPRASQQEIGVQSMLVKSDDRRSLQCR